MKVPAPFVLCEVWYLQLVYCLQHQGVIFHNTGRFYLAIKAWLSLTFSIVSLFSLETHLTAENPLSTIDKLISIINIILMSFDMCEYRWCWLLRNLVMQTLMNKGLVMFKLKWLREAKTKNQNSSWKINMFDGFKQKRHFVVLHSFESDKIYMHYDILMI